MKKEQQQYLTFVIAGEEYAIGILCVKEIIAYDTLTRVPKSAESIRGMINLRGSVVPVVDLAMKFGYAPSNVTRSSCIVIVELELDGEALVVGLMVDAVSEVIELASDDIEAPPQFGTIRADFLIGMAAASATKKFILLLDIDRVLTASDIAIETTQVA